MRGRCPFIVFEGADGCGKSTQAALLYERLTGLGIPCLLTEEPGSTGPGEMIKEYLLHPSSTMDPRTELFLFLADRAEHTATVILPALKEGLSVICSRYLFSTLVYQGQVRRAAPAELLLKMNLFAAGDLLPDIVFFLDQDPEKGLALARSAAGAKSEHYRGGDRIEREGIAFQEKVRQGYLSVMDMFPSLFERIRVGRRTRESIAAEVFTTLERRCL